ncbi:hypothetical protein OIU77_025362 [Salix suchowensis]|uniref:Uncharacterized protein n=1 Tax=Salix suchowensis TaxID=1278906 RepID=A0ABQ9BYV9_9ROSI|nr:hypothetical protein OIU77_025362 [Salix suchowensis]
MDPNSWNSSKRDARDAERRQPQGPQRRQPQDISRKRLLFTIAVTGIAVLLGSFLFQKKAEDSQNMLRRIILVENEPRQLGSEWARWLGRPNKIRHRLLAGTRHFLPAFPPGGPSLEPVISGGCGCTSEVITYKYEYFCVNENTYMSTQSSPVDLLKTNPN